MNKDEEKRTDMAGGQVGSRMPGRVGLKQMKEELLRAVEGIDRLLRHLPESVADDPIADEMLWQLVLAYRSRRF